MNSSYSPLVSVIVVNYNGKDFLIPCIDSILRSAYSTFEVIIVDNCSSDGSLKPLEEIVEKHKSKIQVIRLTNNTGYALGNNIGAEMAKGEYLAFLNNDTQVDSAWLGRLMEVMNMNPQFAVCGCKERLLDKRSLICQAGWYCDTLGFTIPRGSMQLDCGQFDALKEMLYVQGSSFLIRKKVFNLLGGFDSSYELYAEDLDLCWNAWMHGFQVLFVPQAIVYHRRKATTERFLGHAQQRYLIERNTLRTLIKNYSGRNLLKIIPKYLSISFVEFMYYVLSGKKAHAVSHARSIIWNLSNFADTWKRREFRQSSRLVDDRTILELMCKDSLKLSYFRGFVRSGLGSRDIQSDVVGKARKVER